MCLIGLLNTAGELRRCHKKLMRNSDKTARPPENREADERLVVNLSNYKLVYWLVLFIPVT